MEDCGGVKSYFMSKRPKNPRPMKPNGHRFWHTEGIDYLKTGKRSIWGGCDPETLKVLRPLRLKGTWLHLAAGDGRYNALLLRKVDKLIASDIDPSALEKSRRNVLSKYRKKFSLKAFDVVKKFPFEADSIDGVFCVGTLHLFPKHVLRRITREIDRVVRPRGMVFVDFATHVKRVRFDGKPYIVHGEPLYTNADAKKTLEKMFQGYKTKFWKGSIPKESYPSANPPYTYESKFLIMLATKSGNSGDRKFK